MVFFLALLYWIKKTEAFMLTNDNWTDENIAISEEYTDKISRMIKLLEGRIELLKEFN